MLIKTFDPMPQFSSLMISSAQKYTPAHGHSNPWFGPPDPHLNGHSIAPSTRSLTDMGLPPPKSVAELVPDATPEMQQSIKSAIKGGYKFIDASKMLEGSGASHFRGFAETKGILAQPMVHEMKEKQWGQLVDNVLSQVHVLDKLPTAAFLYLLVEFFILRPNVDLYKEDIEEDATGVLIESTVSIGVRMVALAIVGVITLIIFKK